MLNKLEQSRKLDLPRPVWDNENMEIQKTDLRNYDARYIQAVQGETARSIKPNVFKEVSREVQLALWLTDLVELSPEAQTLLKKFKQKGGKGGTEIDWLPFLEALEEFRQKLEGKPTGKKKGDGFLNFVTLPVMRPPLQEVLPRQGGGKKKKETVRSQAALLLETMIVKYPGEEVKGQLISELEPLSISFIDTCRSFGVRIVVLRRNELLSSVRIHQMALTLPGQKTSDGRMIDEVRGHYLGDRRLMIMGEETIGAPPRLTSVHELAHAYDHAFSEKHGRKHQLSTQLWNLFAGNRTAFITTYASSSPAEYFAESVEAYFIAAKRPLLEKHDPRMFEFLGTLFEENHRAP